MTKGKSIFLLTVVCVLLAVLAAATFIRFPMGTKDFNSILGAISLDYDIAGGSAYTVSLDKDNTEEIENVNDVMDILRVRMDALGYKSYQMTAVKDTADGVKDYSIRVVAKTTDNLTSDVQTVFKYGQVKFFGGTEQNPTTQIMADDKAIETSEYVGSYVDTNNKNVYQVSLKFTDYGYDALMDSIGDNSTYYLKITLDSESDPLLNASISKDSVSDKTVYITAQTEEEANRLALQLKTGGLKYKYDLEDMTVETIAPVLGENTPLFLIIAVAAVLVAAIAFFTVRYKGYGLIAGLSLLFFILVETSMLIAVPGITLSLGGVFGMVLASILAVDGLFIVAKRFGDEYANGKTVKAAVKTAFDKSFLGILNTNVFALIVGLLLFAFSTGAIYNFAVTFSIGVVVSFITTVLIARMFTVLILPLLNKAESFLNLKRTDA
ncbi:MAG: hypothetical protein E7369_01360 [Clostridiales bacterium]|nr:hypothetical protein [Clostridiales bacterium]